MIGCDRNVRRNRDDNFGHPGVAFPLVVFKLIVVIGPAIIASLVAGDIVAAEDLGGTLKTILVRSVLLPAVLQILGDRTWRLPHWLHARLPDINIEGSAARALRPTAGRDHDDASGAEPAPAAA